MLSGLSCGYPWPGLFALYSDLVESIFFDDELAFLSTINAIAEFDAEAPTAVRGVTITDVDLGAGIADRFLHQLDDDPSTPVRVTPVSTEELSRAKNCLAETWSLLDTAAPELADEIRALFATSSLLDASRAPTDSPSMERRVSICGARSS